jgi:hypothetical protein
VIGHIGAFNTLQWMLALSFDNVPSNIRTIKTYSKSSRTSASCTSNGILSRLSSALPFPFDFDVVATPIELTLELRGALTKEVSAMKDGSPATEDHVKNDSNAWIAGQIHTKA